MTVGDIKLTFTVHVVKMQMESVSAFIKLGEDLKTGLSKTHPDEVKMLLNRINELKALLPNLQDVLKIAVTAPPSTNFFAFEHKRHPKADEVRRRWDLIDTYEIPDVFVEVSKLHPCSGDLQRLKWYMAGRNLDTSRQLTREEAEKIWGEFEDALDKGDTLYLFLDGFGDKELLDRYLRCNHPGETPEDDEYNPMEDFLRANPDLFKGQYFDFTYFLAGTGLSFETLKAMSKPQRDLLYQAYSVKSNNLPTDCFIAGVCYGI